jgi:hypothetical protein
MYEETPSDSTNPPAPTRAETLKTWVREGHVPAWLALALVALLILAFAWKQFAVGAAQRALDSERMAMTQQLADEKTRLRATAGEFLARNSDAAHVLMGTTLAWAVRGELIRDNLDQIDQFFGELIRNDRVRVVLLAGADGVVRLATDRKLQGGAFSAHFPEALLAEPAVVIRPGADGEKWLVLPIQGLNSRLGTVLVAYRPEPGMPE